MSNMVPALLTMISLVLLVPNHQYFQCFDYFQFLAIYDVEDPGPKPK